MFPLSNTHKKIVGIALPMTLASGSIPLLGLVDTAILGHLASPIYLAAVAVGGSIMTFIGWLFAFLRMGNTGLTAQAMGNNNHSRNREILFQSLLLAITLGIIVIGIAPLVLPLAVNIMQPDVSTQGLILDYCQIRIFAAPASFGTSTLLGWLLGNQKAKACLIILLTTNFLNIFLDYGFIVLLEMNSTGAAWASFYAELTGFIVALTLAARHCSNLKIKEPVNHLFDLKNYLPLFRINQFLFLRTCCIVFTLAFFHAQGARFGSDVLAANAILIQLLLLVAYTQDGFAHAGESIAGHALGSKNLAGFFQATSIITYWGLALAILATSVLWSFPSQISSLFTDIAVVRDQLLKYWFWLSLLPLASFYCFMADGIFIGANKSFAMLTTTLAATFVVFIPLWAITRPYGNDGLWFAYVLFLVARSVLMGGVFIYTTKRQHWLA